MKAMTEMENAVINWTGCNREIANTVVNEILSINEKTNEINPLHYSNLSDYINSHTAFKLKHVIEWCCKQNSNQVADTLLLYIHENNLSDMDAQYVINHIPFNEFASRGVAQEYEKYLGYDMYKVG